MTITERIASLIGFAPSNPNVIIGECTDMGLTPTAAYDASQQVAVKTAAIHVMETLLTTADTTNGEVGFSIKYDRSAILKRIDQLKNELGLIDTALPNVKSRPVW